MIFKKAPNSTEERLEARYHEQAIFGPHECVSGRRDLPWTQHSELARQRLQHRVEVELVAAEDMGQQPAQRPAPQPQPSTQLLDPLWRAGVRGWFERRWLRGEMEGGRDGGMEEGRGMDGWKDGGMEGWRDGSENSCKEQHAPCKVLDNPRCRVDTRTLHVRINRSPKEKRETTHS